MKGLKTFMSLIDCYHTPVWIRHVMVPSYTDTDESMQELLKLSKEILLDVEKIEILPYHKLGTEKYSQLELLDPLINIEEMNEKEAQKFELKINQSVSQVKKE